MKIEIFASEKTPTPGYMFVYFYDHENAVVIKKIVPVYEGGGRL